VRGVDAAAEAGQRDEPDGVRAGGPVGGQAPGEVRGLAVHEQLVHEPLRHGRRGGRAAAAPPSGRGRLDRVLPRDGHGAGAVGRHRHVRRDLPAQPALGQLEVGPRLRPDVHHELEGGRPAGHRARRADRRHHPRRLRGRAEVHHHAVRDAGRGPQHPPVHRGHEDAHVGARLDAGQPEAVPAGQPLAAQRGPDVGDRLHHRRAGPGGELAPVPAGHDRAARAEAEHEPAGGQIGQGRGAHREQRRRPGEDRDHRGLQADPRRSRGHGRDQGEDLGAGQLPDLDAGQPAALRRHREVPQRGRRLAVSERRRDAHVLEPVYHSRPPFTNSAVPLV